MSSSMVDNYQQHLQAMWHRAWFGASPQRPPRNHSSGLENGEEANNNNSNGHPHQGVRYRDRGPLKSWRPETMAEAILAVLQEGLSLSQAARKNDIPYPTFVLYANRVHNMLGPPMSESSPHQGSGELRPKGRGRPQRILLGSWPEEHVRQVIKAVVFRDGTTLPNLQQPPPCLTASLMPSSSSKLLAPTLQQGPQQDLHQPKGHLHHHHHHHLQASAASATRCSSPLSTVSNHCSSSGLLGPSHDPPIPEMLLRGRPPNPSSSDSCLVQSLTSAIKGNNSKPSLVAAAFDLARKLGHHHLPPPHQNRDHLEHQQQQQQQLQLQKQIAAASQLLLVNRLGRQVGGGGGPAELNQAAISAAMANYFSLDPSALAAYTRELRNDRFGDAEDDDEGEDVAGPTAGIAEREGHCLTSEDMAPGDQDCPKARSPTRCSSPNLQAGPESVQNGDLDGDDNIRRWPRRPPLSTSPQDENRIRGAHDQEEQHHHHQEELLIGSPPHRPPQPSAPLVES